MRNRDNMHVVFAALLAMIVIGCIAVAGASLYRMEKAEKTSEMEDKKEAEPLVINTYPKVSKGILTAIDSEQGVVFQYDGDIQIHYSEAEKKTYVNVYIDYPDCAYE